MKVKAENYCELDFINAELMYINFVHTLAEVEPMV
jgi:hypothetical protein